MNKTFNRFRLVELLEERNITKYQFSKMSGIPHSTLSELTTGKRKDPQFSTISKIAEALDVKIDEFYCRNIEKVEETKQDEKIDLKSEEGLKILLKIMKDQGLIKDENNPTKKDIELAAKVAKIAKDLSND